MEGQTETRICRKCLLADIPEDQIYQTLKKQIAQIDPDQRVSDHLYQKRLSHCRGCEKLLTGMCRSCGCYIEYRAALLHRDCPEHKWRD